MHCIKFTFNQVYRNQNTEILDNAKTNNDYFVHTKSKRNMLSPWQSIITIKIKAI